MQLCEIFFNLFYSDGRRLSDGEQLTMAERSLRCNVKRLFQFGEMMTAIKLTFNRLRTTFCVLDIQKEYDEWQKTFHFYLTNFSLLHEFQGVDACQVKMISFKKWEEYFFISEKLQFLMCSRLKDFLIWKKNFFGTFITFSTFSLFHIIIKMNNSTHRWFSKLQVLKS